ncbi:hypothetical protein KBI23_06600 [bacterium]|nr:hypothetical protein [bacterium]MBP9807129.1 hypothetical protein [bacterium]
MNQKMLAIAAVSYGLISSANLQANAQTPQAAQDVKQFNPIWNLERDTNEDLLRHALALQERHDPQDPEKLAEVRLALATSLKCANKLSAARELAELALEAQEKLFGKGSKKTKLALMLLSSIYLNNSSNHFNEKEVAQLEKLLHRLAKIDREQTASMRVQLAQIYLTQKQPRKAEKLWFQSIALLHKDLPYDCKDLAKACKQIFCTFIRDQHYDDAQALARGMAQYGFDRDVLISAANGFVVLSQQQESFGNDQKAERLAKRALETSEKYGDKKTCSYTSAIKQYAALLRKQGKEEQAKEIEKQ